MADLYTAWVADALVVSNGFWCVMSRVAMLSIFELAFCVLGFYLLYGERYTLSGAVRFGYRLPLERRFCHCLGDGVVVVFETG